MKSLIFLAFVFIAATGMAQMNFSGTWNFKEKQTVLGPEYANALANKLTVQQGKDSLIIEAVTIDADDKHTKSRSATAMNGKPVETISPATGRKIVRSLQWSGDQKTLTITSNIYKEGDPNEVELTRIDTWNLSADGKQLLLNRNSVETISESWEVKGVFEKQ